MQMAFRRTWVIVGLVAMLVVVSCGGSEIDDDQVQVVASTSIVGALVEEVVGEHADVTVLMEPGTDSHTYEVTPGDARAIEGADIVFINGLDLDNGLVENAGVDSSNVQVVEISRDIDSILPSVDDEHNEHDEDEHDEHDEDDEDEHDEDEHDEDEAASGDEESGEDAHDHGDLDPHVWMDPLRVQVMVDTIAEALAEFDPDNADEYRNNAEAYSETLEETHQEILAMVDQVPEDQRKLVTNHDSFSYFADRYGFEVVGTVIPGTTTEAEPSAQDIADLHELIAREGITVIFAEELVDPKIAEQIAADTGTVIVYGLYTEQLGEPGSAADTVHGMLLENARIITGALTNN